METLKSLDLVVVTFVTDNVDIDTIHIYGRDHTDEELAAFARECFIAQYDEAKIGLIADFEDEQSGIDAAKGFEVLCVSR